ncbi:N-acetylglucosamine kinase-like BadF-type ATPase [Motilibacter rhizosphaerae]|uniref:N-acetylglucosamine kinase-like BadF-type ATPase n=1 Tax=Motilibacter rhizosphaerae TaxID=598652 RepID=A0A4Q7NUQ3_9ACTN|nr:BadF/BadG/BcrA/BcrD ATPase family protein [Motilibacter rhizosphaerae]RZS90897.1 N-acetylglucosamine kinase-like BadF-type ATPase [Motilibacter rhizosphaerae]
MSAYLGIDGGGTKTALCVLSDEGEVLASTVAPSCYYLFSPEGPALVERVLGVAVPEVCAAAGMAVDAVAYVFAGLPAHGEVSRDVPAVDAAVGAALGHARYAVANDTVCAWAGSLAGADGINVVSGTGSITYGERAGRGVRVGGWGEAFGDEGSGHWVAVRGLQAFTKMADGRLPPGPLLDVLRARLGLGTDLDLVDVVLNRWQRDRREVAALSREVVAAAEEGDAAAAAILSDAADELVELVEATRRRLGFAQGEAVPVSWSGGMLSAALVREPFLSRLRARYPGYDARTPLHPPVVGAALHAAQLAGAPLSAEALQRLAGQ